MENPASWGRLEGTVHEAIRSWNENQKKGLIGYSLPAFIANRLRAEGLTNETPEDRQASAVSDSKSSPPLF